MELLFIFFTSRVMVYDVEYNTYKYFTAAVKFSERERVAACTEVATSGMFNQIKFDSVKRICYRV